MSESSDPLYAVTMAAANLKAAAPDQFDALLQALKKLDQKCSKDLKSASADGIFAAQGRSVLADQLVDRFENCLERRKSYQNRP